MDAAATKLLTTTLWCYFTSAMQSPTQLPQIEPRRCVGCSSMPLHTLAPLTLLAGPTGFQMHCQAELLRPANSFDTHREVPTIGQVYTAT